MQGNYRKIQPAPRDDADEIDRKFRVAKRKRQHVRIACNPCREKKRACQTRSLACIYRIPPKTVDSTIKIQKQLDTLQHSFNHYADIVDQLKTLPETDALKLLQRLRSPADVNGAFASLQGSAHTRLRLSNHRTAQAILPTTNSRLEFELTALHGIVYPTLAPIDITSLGISPLDKPALPAAQTETLVRKISPASPVVLSSDRSRQLCDSRLEEIDISYWTKVPISNETAAAMISLFLETDQTIVGFVDADLFVESLVERTPHFCSTFLVSAMLYVACHAYTAFDLESVAVGRLCFQETERLFRAEGSFDDLITLAAINTFSLACRFHGHEMLAQELVASARHMGRRLGLYGVPLDSPSSLAFQELPDDLVRMTAHVAWGTYNWLTIHVLYFHDESIAIPPALPVPGHERHDDLWPQHPLPEYMGSSFTKLCEYFTVIQEVAVVYSIGDGKPVVDHVPIAFAEAKYQKILAWADSLGRDMAWDQNSQEHVMLFHMWFHCAVLDIFRPFAHGRHKNYTLKSFSSQDSTPKTIFSASLNQLKRLALLYRTQQMPNSYMPYINISLIHIANTICRETNDPTAKFYFLLCIRYWQHLYVGYPIFGGIAQAFLTMAINNGLITNREAKRLMAEVKAQGGHHDEGISTSLIVDFDLAMTNRDEADVQAVAQKFEEVALFDEFAVYKKED
ncbi:conidial development fluffy [Fusarium pseudoanthophilum]|uniref:Conidial development fluffy n=1 Tax=Fusarium pseudoanthophilum TaxID=48495 RepID=A0A8H5P493_9HYPO|nr:conidial development fluffy [Fusarium pseudoanthophilum]